MTLPKMILMTNNQDINIIAVDFDAVINPYKVGFMGWDKIPEEPISGCKEVLTQLRNHGWKIIIHSVRAKHLKGYEALNRYLRKYRIPFDEIWRSPGKPRAEIYLDDRALKFEGNWYDTYNQIKNFETYQGKIRDDSYNKYFDEGDL